MRETSARLLKLLTMLASRPWWSGAELADALQVTRRTVRRDIHRLRTLDYPVESVPGPAGGYRLGPGGRLPPLLLDDDEAVAVAVCLRSGATGSVAGIADAAMLALAKLEQTLPANLRSRIDAIDHATVPLAREADVAVDPDLLVALAQACRANERLRFDYRTHDGRSGRRLVEPYRLVHTGRRWYLVAWDTNRDAWRTFRVDRVSRVTPTGQRFRRDSDPDAAAMVSRAISTSPYAEQVRVRLHAPPEQMAARIPPTVGLLEPDGDDTLLTTGAPNLAFIVAHLAAFEVDFTVVDPPELRERISVIADRLQRAAAHDL